MTRVWAKRGTRPTAVRQTQYGYVYVLAAVSTSLGMAEGMIATHLDTDIINRFLEAFSNRLPSDLHAVLVWDGAGFHQAKELRCPSNVTLVSLPPYSPELNPVENLWHYLKSHYWSNRRYALRRRPKRLASNLPRFRDHANHLRRTLRRKRID